MLSKQASFQFHIFWLAGESSRILVNLASIFARKNITYCNLHFDFINPLEKYYLQIVLQPMQFYCEEMGDVETKMNNGKD